MANSALVLAAGDSSRMGRHKILLPFNGMTLIEHIVNQLTEAGVSEVVVVVGKGAPSVREALAETSAVIAENVHYQNGMLSSVRVGLAALSDESQRVAVCLGDQPAIRCALVRALFEQAAAQPGKIIVPVYEGRRGHPLLIPRCHWSSVLERYEDLGLRGLLQEHASSVLEWLVDDAWVLDDMDYPEDYARELRRLEEESDPD
ncbi:MAG: nucleotidyltransferase family protein [Candidatus Hydrogenedentota bacterium]